MISLIGSRKSENVQWKCDWVIQIFTSFISLCEQLRLFNLDMSSNSLILRRCIRKVSERIVQVLVRCKPVNVRSSFSWKSNISKSTFFLYNCLEVSSCLLQKGKNKRYLVTVSTTACCILGLFHSFTLFFFLFSIILIVFSLLVYDFAVPVLSHPRGY